MRARAELFDRGLLRRRRSRFAGEVSQHEFLLARVATEIAERIEAILRKFPLALDLGAFNGVLGRRVGALPSVKEMIYAESAPALAKLCPRPVVVCDEDFLPFRDGSLSLVVSGLALHRVNDLPGALIQIRRALHPDGLFLGAALGGRSLQELRQSLLDAEAEEEGGASPRIAPFADVRDYGALLQRAGFALPVTDADLLTVIYPSPRDLMLEIRALGGGNVMASRRKEPFYLSGWAPHESQQRPLKPGSAVKRLADALHTEEHSAGDKASFPAKRKR
jgi:SAM-dependent methyltransferase